MGKNLLRLFTAAMMAALLCSAAMIGVSAAGETSCTVADHAAEANHIPIAQDDFVDGKYSISQTGTYYLTDNVTGTIIASSGTATLCMNGKNITCESTGSTANDVAIRASGNVVLTLINCETSGGTIKRTNSGAYAIRVENSASVTVQENVHVDESGTAGVFVGRGTFTLDGGTVSGNTGVGVQVNNAAASFVMEKGTITGNSATNGAGVYVQNGSFTMNGGTIGGTYTKGGTTMTGNAVTSYGGGVYVQTGSFTMNDGAITGNTAPAQGAGVYNLSTFTMNGGSITNNTYSGTNQQGAQLRAADGSFTMSGGTISGTENHPLWLAKGTASFTGGTVTLDGTTSGTAIRVAGAETTFSQHATVNSTGNVVYAYSGSVAIQGGAFDGKLAKGSSISPVVTGGRFSISPTMGVSAGTHKIVETGLSTETTYVYRVVPITLGDCSTHEGWEEITVPCDITKAGSYCLANNITGRINMKATGDVTLCLNGKNITNTDGYAIAATSGSLNLINCNETAGGTIQSDKASSRAINISSSASVTINDNICVTAPNAVGVFLLAGKFTMNGGEIRNCGSYGVQTNYASDPTASIFNMDGGTITETHTAVYVQNGTFKMTNGRIAANEAGAQGTTGVILAGTSTMTMTNGTISGAGNTLRSHGTGTIEISGGTIEGVDLVDAETGETILAGSCSIFIYGTGTVKLSDDVIVKGKHISNFADTTGGTVDISGGSFACAVECTNNVIITGGRFSGDTAAADLAGWVSDGYGMKEVWTDDSDYVYTVGTGVEGFYSSGEHMDFGSSLDLGLYLLSKNSTSLVGCSGDTSAYNAELDADADPAPILYARGIAAKDMDKKITFKVMKGSDVLFQKTVSIYDAAKKWHEDEDKATMMADMLNYGNAAKAEFDEGSTPMNVAGMTGSSDVPTWTAVGTGVDADYKNLVAVSLNLKERIELNVYVKDEGATVSSVSGATTAAPASTTVTNDSGETFTKFTFSDIPVNRAKTAVEFTVNLNDDSFTMSYSIADYAILAQNGEQSALIQALMKYVQSVIDYDPAGV